MLGFTRFVGQHQSVRKGTEEKGIVGVGSCLLVFRKLLKKTNVSKMKLGRED